MEDNMLNLVQKSKRGLSIFINPHKFIKESVENYLDLHRKFKGIGKIDEEISSKIVLLDNIVVIHFYVENRFYKVIHYNLNTAINSALELMEKQK